MTSPTREKRESTRVGGRPWHGTIHSQTLTPRATLPTGMSASLPPEVEERAKSIKEDNPDMDKSTAIAIARDQLNLADKHDSISLEEDPCEDGWVMVGTKQKNGRTVPNCVPAEDADPANLASFDDCPDNQVNINGECVPYEEIDAPPSLLSSPHHLTLKSLDTEPIERVEESGDMVRYKNLKLLSPGIWADAGSQTETYYPPEGIANLEAHYNDAEYDGPPVNIMHDLDMEDFEAHEASVAGHVDPDTLATDDDGNLFGDIVFDTSRGAGQFADDNLKSTLEKEGTVGFGGPSVEIPAEGLQQSHDSTRDMPRVDGGRLTGVAMVMDPASKTVNFAREAARRPVAMSAGGAKGKVLTHESDDMAAKTLADPDDIRSELEQYNIDTEGMDDDDLMEFAEALHDDLMDALEMADDEDDEEDDEEGAEMESDMDDEEEDDEDMEMADDEIESMREQLANLSSRLEDVEDAVSQAMTAEDVDAELEDAKGAELAAADTVEEVKKTLADMGETVEAIANEPDDSKTLADMGEHDFEPNYDADTTTSTGW